MSYAKRNLNNNNDLLNKIKKEMPRSKSSLTSLNGINISQSKQNVNWIYLLNILCKKY